MADEVTPEEQPKVEEAPKEAPKAKALDPSRDLSSQTAKILDQLPEEPAEKPADKPEEPADKPEEPKVEEPKVEESEEPVREPVELPPVAKYILDNLPQIQTVGHTANGKDRVFNIKRAEDLPDGFEFADRKTEILFNAAIASQELNARELLGKYQQQEQQNQVEEYLNQEAADIQADIEALQSEELLGKFKYDSKDAKFNSDPAVKEANAIYDLYKQTNEAYMKAGRTYRVSYRDAADKYFAAQARTKVEDKPDNRQEREKVAAKVGGQGTEPSKVKVPLPAGSDFNDVMRLYKQGRI